MTARIFVLGFVQGVGYRYFVKKIAQKIGITGWVKNLPDSRVEILAQGPEDKINILIKACEKGPFFSDVKSVQVEKEKDSEKFGGFEIIHHSK